MEKTIRKPITKRESLIVFRRDAWTCRYCDQAVFFTPMLKVLQGLNPGHGYYHPNGKTGSVLDVFQWQWVTVDHIKPVSKGGLNTLDNYVTACWRCNLSLNDRYLDKDGTVPLKAVNQNMKWDGFSGLYLKLGPKDGWHKLIAMSDEELMAVP